MATLRANISLFICALLSILLWLLHASYYSSFVTDDAFISLQYSKRLIQGLGLTWTEGERVEGYSNLLWVLGCSALGLIGIPLPETLRVMGVLGMGAALAGLYYGWPKRSRLWALVPGLAFATSGLLAAWTYGGLEQALLVGLLSWALSISLRATSDSNFSRVSLHLTALLYGLITITRSDGILFGIAAAGILFFLQINLREKLKVSLCILGYCFVFYFAQTLFRVLYYGEWVSNIALIKLVLSERYLQKGLQYVLRGYSTNFPLVVLALMALPCAFKSRASAHRILLILFPLCIWSAYLILIGGDVNPPSRHFVPIIVLLCFMLRELVFATMVETRARIRTTILAVALLIPFQLFFQIIDVENREARNNVAAIEARDMGLFFKRAFGSRNALLALDSAGALGFYSDLSLVDMLGLNDYFLPRNPPKDLGQGWLGHELGSGDYLLKRSPDLLVFNWHFGGERAKWRSGHELLQSIEFHERYSLARFLPIGTAGPLAKIWVKREGGGTGIIREPSAVKVPAYLSGNPSIYTPGQGVLTRLDLYSSIRLPKFDLDTGNWVIASQPEDIEGLEGSLYLGSTTLCQGKLPLECALPTQTTAQIEIKTTRRVWLQGVELRAKK